MAQLGNTSGNVGEGKTWKELVEHAEGIGGARIERIARAGHLIGLERPEPYAAAVLRFAGAG